MGGLRANPSELLVNFDYSQLSRSKQVEVREEARVIHQLIAKTASHIVQIGLRLNSVRRLIGRKHFQAWLAGEFQWSQPSASRFMRAAQYFGSVECLNQFQPGALYVLASKRIPDEARREALDKARSGRTISKSMAEVIVLRYRSNAHRQNAGSRHAIPNGIVKTLTGKILAMNDDELYHLSRELSALLLQIQHRLTQL